MPTPAQVQSNAANGLPDWYEPEAPPAPTAAPSGMTGAPNDNQPLPTWYTPESTDTVNVTGDAPDSLSGDLGDAAANVGTGVARIPGAILGTPQMLGHTLDWLLAHATNTANAVVGKDTNYTGADFDPYNPIASVLPSSGDVDKGVFKGISAVAGHDVQPYQPTSFLGKLAQAAITGAGAGLLDPVAFGSVLKSGGSMVDALSGAAEGMGGRAAKMAIGADAANATSQEFPDSPALAAAAALIAHGGAGFGGRLATTGKDIVAPLWNPPAAADTVAGRVLGTADNSQPGLANPTEQDFDSATAATKAATDALGTGTDDYTAGGDIRSDLQARSDALVAARGKAADDAYATFRSQPPMPGTELAPLMSSPSFRQAIKSASNGSLDNAGKPLTDLFAFKPEDNGEPTIVPNAAIPPDVLDRIKVALDGQVNGAKTGLEAGDLKGLRSRFLAITDARYPQTYPTARGEFAANSQPLNPLETGTPGKVLDSNTAFGNRTYMMPQDKIPNTFLKSPALRTDFNNLISAYGGDKVAATTSLRQSLIGKVQDAINPDGTLSTDAFNRAVKPYTPALNMWFPDLAKQFNTAQGAQAALDNMKAQEGLAQSVKEGGLRNDDGLVTSDTVYGWLAKNAKALGKTQDPATVMRLKQIAAALPHAPTAGAAAVVEGAPALAGLAYGGPESGIFGAMFHSIPSAIAGPRLAQFSSAYSSAIEKAFTDPAYAAGLASRIAKKPVGITSVQALGKAILEDMGKGVLAAPTATIAGGAMQ